MKKNHDTLSLVLFSAFLLGVLWFLFASATGRFEQHLSWVNSVAVSNDLVVSASEHELLFWDGGKCTDRLVGHTNTIKKVSFSDSGDILVSGGIDKLVLIWSVQEKKILKKLSAHTEGVNNVAFGNSGKYVVSAGYDNNLCIWDWAKDSVIKRYRTHHTYFSINKKNILAYVDSACNLKFIDLSDQFKEKMIGKFCGVPAFNPGKNILALNDMHTSTFTFIDLNSNKILSTLNIKKEDRACEVSTYKFSPDGGYLIASIWGGEIEVWDWQKKTLIRTLQGHTLCSADDLAFTNDGCLISASGDRSLKFWDWEDGDLLTTVGDGSSKNKLFGILSILLLLSLISSFWALSKSNENKISSKIILFILSVWTVGVGFLLYNSRFEIAQRATKLIWISTALSGFLFMTVYLGPFTVFLIPFSLLLCYFRLLMNSNEIRFSFSLIVNLIFCGILCSYVISTGWR